MGPLRFLLAAAVLFQHAGGWGYVASDSLPTGFLSGSYAVEACFVISGFYMALIHDKYAGLRNVFYVNRYSRLIVPYWIVGGTTLLSMIAVPQAKYPFLQELQAPASDWLSWPRLAGAFANVSLLARTQSRLLTCPGEYAYRLLLVPQGWSLGSELLFYLCVPLLSPLRTRALIVITALSAAARVGLGGTGLPFLPWEERFYPAIIMFFLVGMLSFRNVRAARSTLSYSCSWLLRSGLRFAACSRHQSLPRGKRA
jgi:peptidoglycan/LPS O-acetylase OafA/YrhL